MAHSTKNDREQAVKLTPENENGAQKGYQMKSAQETSEESQSPSLGEMQSEARREGEEKKALCWSCTSTESSQKTEKHGKKELQRHCEEVCTDPDETREVQEKN